MDGINANDLFQASAFSKGYNGKRAKGFFTTLISCNMCQCFVRIASHTCTHTLTHTTVL